MPRLKVTARSNSPFGDIDDAQHKFVIKVGTGLKGEKGDKGDKGDTGDTGPSVPVAQTLGQSTTDAVSQKLLTDTVGDIATILDSINGVAV